MSLVEKAVDLVEEALRECDDPSVPVSSLLRKAARIARLRGDAINLLWIEMEMYPLKDESSKRRLSRELQVQLSPEEYESIWTESWNTYLEGRKVKTVNEKGQLEEKGQIESFPVSAIEAQVEHLQSEMAATRVPPGLPAAAVYNVAKEKDRYRQIMAAVVLDRLKLLSGVRERIHHFLSTTERELALGQASSEIFLRAQRFADQRLADIAPETLDQFKSVYRRLMEGEPEALSQALTTCRRILKALADVVYPASSELAVGSDGKSRSMSDKKFISRLRQFTFETAGGSSAGEMVLAEVDDVGTRLDKLNALSSKGVHDQVDIEEAERCIIQTYLVLADILRLKERA